jgi:hypothetical protein
VDFQIMIKGLALCYERAADRTMAGKKRLRGKRGNFGKAETLEAEILK